MDRTELTRAVKSVARERGAALVGVAPVERFDPMPPVHDAAPKGQHPRDFVPGARSVVSFAMPILGPVLDAPAVLAESELEAVPKDARRHYFDVVYGRVGHVLHDYHLELIGQMIGQFLLAQGYQTMIFPTTGVHPRIGEKTKAEIWADAPLGYSSGPFSHRHAATRAGLGEFGYSNVVLTREFGPRQRFNSVVTDAELEPDPLIEKPICLRDGCRLCLKACVMECISLRTDESNSDYRSLDSDDPERIFIDTPSRSFPLLCMSRTDAGGEFPVRGDCLRICPVPRRPERLPERLARIRCGKAP
jgi:epoxyqueuosine reductase QueG